MVKNENRVALLLFGVVVIVAVVGLVSMFMGSSTQTVVSESGDDAALTGEAFRISQARASFPPKATINKELAVFELIEDIDFNRRYSRNGAFTINFNSEIQDMSALDLIQDLSDLNDMLGDIAGNGLDCEVLDTPPPYGSMRCT
jgi:hypothetical protein